MAGYEKYATFTDQGPVREARYTFTTQEADLLALLVEHVVDGDPVEFRPSELITFSRIKAVLDEAADWVEGSMPVNPDGVTDDDNWEN